MTIPQCSLSYWTSYCTWAMGSGANCTITTSIWWSLYCLVLLVLDQSASFLQINPGYVKTVSFLRVCWISLEWNSDWCQTSLLLSSQQSKRERKCVAYHRKTPDGRKPFNKL